MKQRTINPTCTHMKQIKAALGMDAAQAGVVIHLIDTNNNEVLRAKLAANHKDLAKLTKKLAALGLEWLEVLVAVESTGPWRLAWCEKLHALGTSVYVINPLVAKRTTTPDNAIRDHKTDPLDAAAGSLRVDAQDALSERKSIFC